MYEVTNLPKYMCNATNRLKLRKESGEAMEEKDPKELRLLRSFFFCYSVVLNPVLNLDFFLFIG